mmetsp:Transcript_80871/g.247142  ORF Transcript_80871/g.247142 Transcript_80871/m.247142 type:complete len:284 (-) Transcript_80871:323-1174(-)
MRRRLGLVVVEGLYQARAMHRDPIQGALWLRRQARRGVHAGEEDALGAQVGAVRVELQGPPRRAERHGAARRFARVVQKLQCLLLVGPPLHELVHVEPHGPEEVVLAQSPVVEHLEHDALVDAILDHHRSRPVPGRRQVLVHHGRLERVRPALQDDVRVRAVRAQAQPRGLLGGDAGRAPRRDLQDAIGQRGRDEEDVRLFRDGVAETVRQHEQAGDGVRDQLGDPVLHPGHVQQALARAPEVDLDFRRSVQVRAHAFEEGRLVDQPDEVEDEPALQPEALDA